MIVRGLRFGHSGLTDVLYAGASGVSRDHERASADVRARRLPRSAEEGHGGSLRELRRRPSTASTTRGSAFPPRAMSSRRRTPGDARPGAACSARSRGALTSGPVVKSAGVLSIFALGAAVGTLSARDADVGWVAKRTRVRLGTRASLSRASPGHHSSLGLTLAPPRASPLGSPPTRDAIAICSGADRRDAARLVSEKTFFSARRALASHPRASLTVPFPPLSAHARPTASARRPHARASDRSRASPPRTGTPRTGRRLPVQRRCSPASATPRHADGVQFVATSSTRRRSGRCA